MQCALPAGALTQLRLDASDHLCGRRRPGAPLALGYLSCLTALRHLSVTWPGLQTQLPALAATLGSLPTLNHLALSQVFLACMLSSGPQIVIKEAAVLGGLAAALGSLPALDHLVLSLVMITCAHTSCRVCNQSPLRRLRGATSLRILGSMPTPSRTTAWPGASP